MNEERPKWLVCAATSMELQVFWREGETYTLDTSGFRTASGTRVTALTGVGIPFTIARLLPMVQRLRPERILNIGIAGAYPNSGLKIGDIVTAATEVYGDLGFELPVEPGFQSLLDSSMARQMETTRFDLVSVPEWGAESAAVIGGAAGCTVNSCTGTEHTGLLRERRFGAHFETMEGAAVAHVGFITQIPVCEIRAISNIAAQRDMRPENIRLALDNLRRYLETCLNNSE